MSAWRPLYRCLGIVILAAGAACTIGGGGGGGLPADPEIMACTSGDACLELAWAPGPDAGRGVAGYNIYYHAEGEAYGPPVAAGANTGFRLAGLVNGMEYVVRVTALDRSSRESPGALVTGVPMNFAVRTGLVTSGDSTGIDLNV